MAWIFPLIMMVGTQLYSRWNLANPAIPKATLEIESSPQGAAILLDCEDIGITPMSQQVKTGSYRLKVTHGSFPGQVKDTSVVLGSGFAKLVFRFKP